MMEEKPFDNIPVQQWQEVLEHYTRPQAVEHQIALLNKLNNFLEKVAEDDIKKVMELREQIERITNGGGN